LPGGPGTLAEIALTWNLMIVDSIPRKPLILLGKGWQAVFNEMFHSLEELTPTAQRELLLFAGDNLAAVSILNSNA
jgi:predicted Rossmann-fold nucleotide-binding protein